MHEDEIPLPEPEPVGTPVDRSFAEAVRTVALDANEAARGMANARDAFEAESIHQLRVSSKRLRALWQLVRPVIQPQIARAANERLRDMARLLAATRDTQVLSDLLADLRDSEEPLYHAAFDRAGAVLPNAPALEGQAEVVRTAMLEALNADRDEWRSLVLPDNDSLIEHGLGRSYRKTRRRAETAGRTESHEDNHRLRRWVKYLRYQLEALKEVPAEDLARRVEMLHKLGSVLGKRNDLALLRERLIEHGEGDPFGVVFRAIELRDRAFARTMPEAVAQLFRDTPEEFVAVIQSELEAVGSEA